MAQISDHVTTTITVASLTPSRAQFSVPLIASFNPSFNEVVKTYGSLSEIEEDFTSDDAVHKCASAIFAQNPSIKTVKVGRLGTASQARVAKLLPTVLNSTTYTLSINGTEFSYTSDASATITEIVDGLAAAVNAGTEPVTAANATSILSLTGDVSGVDFYFDVDDISLWASIQDTSTGRGSDLSTDLSTIEASDPDWYALILTRNNAADINTAAAWVESRKKILLANPINFGSIVSAEDCLASNSTNVLADLNTAAYDRTFALFSKHDGDFAAAALGSAVLCQDPGSWTAKFKTLSGVTADVLTTSETTLVEGKKGNHYQAVAGVPIVSQGWCSSGQFLDLTVFLDWLDARIKEEVFTALAANSKVPFTDAGVSMIAGVVAKVLQRGVDLGGLASFQVSPDLVADMEDADVTARYANAIRFSAVYAGAIHKVNIVGKVTN